MESRAGGLRIAHLTATFPPYPGGAGNTAFRFAREQAARGHHVEVFTAPAPGERAGPGRRDRAPDRPGVRDRQRPADPVARADRGLRRRPPALPVHLRLRADAARPPDARAAARQALLVHYKNRLVGKGPRGALFEAYEHTVAPALIRAADRVCVLSAGPRRVGPLPAAHGRRATRRSWSRCRTASTRSCSRPAPDASGLRERLGIPADALVAAFVATLDRAHHFKRLDVAIDALAELGERRVAPRRRRRRRAARRVSRARPRRRGRRAGPLPRRRPPRRAARRAAGRRPVPAHHRAAGVVRDRPDRGDGLRAARRSPPTTRACGRWSTRARPGCWSPAGDAERGRRGARRARRRRARGAGRARRGAAGPRRSASGAGRGWSTAWTAPTPRRSRSGARVRAHDRGEPAPADPAGRLLLPALPRHRRAAARPRWRSGCAGSATRSRCSPLGLRRAGGGRRRGRRAHAPTPSAGAPGWRARTRSGRCSTPPPTAAARTR